MADPAVGEFAALQEKITQLFRAAAHGKGFPDDDRFPPGELLEELDLLVHLAGLGIQVRRDEIELFGGRLVRAGEGKHAHGDQVSLVVRADRGDHALRPLAEHIVPIARAGIEAEPLAKFHIAHPAHIPSVGTRANRSRLVDQIVGENGGALGTGAGDGFPEKGLCFPTGLLVHRIIPSHAILCLVAGQAGDLEMDARFLGDLEELSELVERMRIGLVRSQQDTGHLGMDAGNGGAGLLHLGELPLDARRVIRQAFKDIHRGVIVPPGNVAITGRMEDKAFLVRGDFHRLHPRRAGNASKENQEKPQRVRGTDRERLFRCSAVHALTNSSFIAKMGDRTQTRSSSPRIVADRRQPVRSMIIEKTGIVIPHLKSLLCVLLFLSVPQW